MNELVTLVAQRTGLSQEDAQKAVETVIDVLKQKLPAPLANHLDAFLAGEISNTVGEFGAAAGEMLKGAVGSFFGKK
ncbi:MAG TPA: hypothetical protein VGH08_06240 [Chthoniobacterales bacterium]|jgi:uncharacterized protein (DUF2267 family)